MNLSYISIGSNIGDRFRRLQEATLALHTYGGVEVLAVSSVYETEPVGYTVQANFLNLVVKIGTDLSAQDLLEACQKIEQELGRERTVRWGPRTVDLDILLYNNDNIAVEKLTVPHPRMHERAFVLIPLLEIEPSIAHPVTGRLFSEEAAVQDSGVVLWKRIDGVEHFLQMKE
ncbi:2-amino-4-hydroxy-6-hydroxymethyldihydropteridine diphosphokinase [Sporosarcina soli]|uniref:2-amino-4-hydroxy-6-hydroxymethyldihydropteridine diphosphokinase n=1 Tax=Sporosarcina soli TaxID=334736 RepID=A0ABW0TPY3_9BACL